MHGHAARPKKRALHPSIDIWVAAGVLSTTAVADAVYVIFTSRGRTAAHFGRKLGQSFAF